MKPRWRARVVAILLLVFFSTALNLHAAEESAAAGPANEIFKWINFAIVAGAVIWVFAKKLPPVFRRNAERIHSAINKATAAKEEAERLLREAEGKLARLEQEVAALRAEAQRESAADGEHIRALARTEAAKAGVAAQAEMEAAARAARLQLKVLAASLAVDGAESLLAKQLTPAAQESLLDAFAASLEGRPN